MPLSEVPSSVGVTLIQDAPALLLLYTEPPSVLANTRACGWMGRVCDVGGGARRAGRDGDESKIGVFGEGGKGGVRDEGGA
jgi:hypothetical protein